jgi:tetratricopeptide (TPR) repeat protein
MNFVAPDGQATISVNVVPVQGGVTSAQFLEIILGSVTGSMQEDVASGWECTLDQTVTSHGMPVTIRNYHPAKTPATGDLIMTFTPGSTCIFMLNIAVATDMRDQYEPVALACAKSIKDPEISEAPVIESGTDTASNPEPKSSGKVSEVGQLMQFSLEQLYQVEKNLMEEVKQTPTDQENVGYLATVRAGVAIKLYEQGEVKRAIDYLTDAVQIDGTYVDLLELLGDMLDDLAEPSAPYLAQSYYEDALELDASLTACRTKLAASYMSTGDFSDARVHYEYLTQHSGDKPVGSHIRELMLCYVSLDAEDAGIGFLMTMVETGGGPQLYIALSALLNQKGLTKDAVTILQQVERFQNEALTQYAQTLISQYTSAKGGY